MSKLSTSDRKDIPKGDFAIPSKAPGSGSYPIEDASHAKNALARSSGKPVEVAVRAAVHKKYPHLAKDAENAADARVDRQKGIKEGSPRDEKMDAMKKKYPHLAKGTNKKGQKTVSKM